MKNTIALPRWLEGIDGIILVNNPDNFFIELHLNFVDTQLSGDISQPTIINSSLILVEICKKIYITYNVPSMYVILRTHLRMTTGLDKLVEAAESVDILKKELEVKEQEIKEATAKAEDVRLLNNP